MGILRRMLILIENVLSEYINKMGLLYRMLIGLVDWNIGSSTKWVCCTECRFWLKLVNLNTSTKWVYRTEC